MKDKKMKKYHFLVLFILLLSSCGQTKSEPPKPYQTKLNSVFYKNTAVVVEANVYLDRVDIDVRSSIANALSKKGIDNYLDDNQMLNSGIFLELDATTDVESVSVEFPDAKTVSVKPALVTGAGGSSWLTAVTWSAKFNSPPMQWQVVYLVVKVKFKQFEEPIQFEFTKMADVSPDLQQ
jgi:hypothetical protein